MADNVIITKKARENMVKARAGAVALPPIEGMAFGNGGVDSSGSVIVPCNAQVSLASELFRKEIKNYTFTEDTTCRYECTLTEAVLLAYLYCQHGLYLLLLVFLLYLKMMGCCLYNLSLQTS